MAKKESEIPDSSDYMSNIYKSIGENDSNQSVSDHLTTGILPLNYILSGSYQGGIPVGRVTEIYGRSSSGKTLIATMALIETQKKGGIAAFFDFEYAFDVDRGISLGLSAEMGKWIYKQPETAEQGFEMAEEIINGVRKHNAKIPITIVFDSIASMVTKADLEAAYNPNMKSRLSLATFLSTALKRIAGQASKNNTTLIFLNQVRENPGVTFGSNEYTSGGNSMKFYATVRLELSKGAKIEGDDKEIIGEIVRAKTVKNKIHAPFKTVQYITDFSIGVDLAATHIAILKEQGVFGATAGWLQVGDKKYREKEFVKMCKEDPKLMAEILALFK